MTECLLVSLCLSQLHHWSTDATSPVRTGPGTSVQSLPHLASGGEEVSNEFERFSGLYLASLVSCTHVCAPIGICTRWKFNLNVVIFSRGGSRVSYQHCKVFEYYTLPLY